MEGHTRSWSDRESLVSAAAWLTPVILIVYLGINNGGFDAVVLGKAGVVVWWCVLLGILSGLLPAQGLPRAAWVAGGLLCGFAIWTGLAIIWSESAEHTAYELGRVATLLGAFTIAALFRGTANLRRVCAGVAVGVVVITLVALASRLHPQWFLDDIATDFVTQAGRLNYPVGYWNGLAALIALGLPLLVSFGAAPGRSLVRGLATACLPALGLAVYLTVSRGGLAVALIGVAALVVLHPRRWSLVVPLLLGAIGSVVVVAYASGLHELVDGVRSQTAYDQGTNLAVALFIVCALTGLVGVALSRVTGGLQDPAFRIDRRTFWWIVGSISIVAVLAAIVLGVPGEVADRWQDFKQPVTPDAGAGRFTAASGSGRFQWWSSIIDAGQSNPILGIGPGTFEFWFARGDVTATGYITEAHSVYFEAFGEAGILGFLLICGFFVATIFSGLRSSIRSWNWRTIEPEYAAATAALIVFAVAATIDWVWELGVVAVAFMLLAGALVGNARPPAARRSSEASSSEVRSRTSSATVAFVAVVALVAVGTPLLTAAAIRSSQAAFREGDFEEAQSQAQKAGDLMPFAATPVLQEAFVFERIGEPQSAVRAARTAVERESTNWANWYVLSRMESEAGNEALAAKAYQRARELNPRSELFVQEPGG
ncbi:MAG: O-antigen ligase family protein [Solirubrobacterales bacterium]